MTTNRNPLQDFVLTPQQQSLLFAALNSNRPGNSSPSNNAMSLSPAAIKRFARPEVGGADGFQESHTSTTDYSFDGPDSSFDFSFDGATGDKMIGICRRLPLQERLGVT